MTQKGRPFDLKLIGAVLALAVIGVVAVYSATRQDGIGTARKQAVWVALSFAAAVGVSLVDYRAIGRLSRTLYVLNLLALVGVLLFGKELNGSTRWFEFRGYTLQPSEFTKLTTIVTLSTLVQARAASLGQPGTLCLSFVHIVPAMLLILKQPDLGTSLVLVAVWFGILYVAGAHSKHLLMVALAGALTFAAMWHTGLLKPYQKARLTSFWNPAADPQRTGWHTLQSKIAIGSGGLTGKGLFRGTQSQGGFIPEQETDFIFAVIGEETGFLGSVVVLALYCVLVSRALRIALESNDPHGRLIATGIGVMWVFQIFVNLGMTVHIMPVTGLPLPFISKGGSSMMMNAMAAAVLLNIHRHREELRF